MHREGRMLEVRRDGVHRLAARAPKSTPATAAATTIARVADATSVAKVVPSASATKAVSTAATIAVSTNTAYSPGVAATGAMTAVSPTTPPGGGAYPTTSIPKSTWSGSFASLNTASYSPAALGAGAASEASAKPVLSSGALIGIIAGGGAVGLAILAMFFCWCWKKRKAKRDEASWWTIDASLNGRRSVGGNPIPGKGTRLADSEVWGKGESDGDMSVEKNPWNPRDGGPGHDAQRRAYDEGAPFASYGAPQTSPSNYSASPSNYQMSPAAPYAESLSSSVLSPREQLLGLGPAPPNSRSVASSTPTNSHSTLPARPDESSPFKDAPPRPRRPSDTPTFGPEGVSEKANKRKSLKPAPNKKDTIMNFTDAYGDDAPENERWALPQSPPLLPTPVIVPPQRGASRSDSGRSSLATTVPLPASPGLYPPMPLVPSPASTTGSFPPRPHGQEAALPPEGPRVDSKPLKELEDILDSFAVNALNRHTLPPIPDDESLRGSIALSAAAPSVAPLTLNRSPRSPLPQMPTSQSINTLSPDAAESFLAYRQASPYEMSHSVSVYSHAGDIGELPANSTPESTPPVPVGGLAAILQAPAPAIFRSDSTGRTPLGGGVRKAGYRSGDSDSTTLSELADFPSPTATSTHFVRKVSIKQENPVRLTREESLRLREAAQTRRMTAAERDIVSQMGLDSLTLESPNSSRSRSPSALSISPPETPRDFNFGPLGGAPDQRKDAFQDPLQGTGFVPLSAMTLDPGAGNYRSATESIYGMYDDLPVELKGLSRDDPRVSRHISMFGLSPR